MYSYESLARALVSRSPSQGSGRTQGADMQNQRGGFRVHHQSFRRPLGTAHAKRAKTRTDDGESIADHPAVQIGQKEHAAKIGVAITLLCLTAKDPSEAEKAELGLSRDG